ncbi:cold-shock protein [Janthinobacterium sp. BJB412]|nr:cold-shock protein [Janthinobacterium sp. BJB412]
MQRGDQVQHQQHDDGQVAGAASGSASYLAIVVLLVLYLVATLQWRLSTWAAVAYGALSLVCFILYAIDKSAAVNGRWRTPESTLHLLALAGGWPGAILAQQWLRHKSSKLAFRIVFWCTVALNMGAFMWLARWLHRHA